MVHICGFVGCRVRAKLSFIPRPWSARAGGNPSMDLSHIHVSLCLPRFPRLTTTTTTTRSEAVTGAHTKTSLTSTWTLGHANRESPGGGSLVSCRPTPWHFVGTTPPHPVPLGLPCSSILFVGKLRNLTKSELKGPEMLGWQLFMAFVRKQLC